MGVARFRVVVLGLMGGNRFKMADNRYIGAVQGSEWCY